MLARAAVLSLAVALGLDLAGAGLSGSAVPAAAGVVFLLLAVIFPRWPRRR